MAIKASSIHFNNEPIDLSDGLKIKAIEDFASGADSEGAMQLSTTKLSQMSNEDLMDRFIQIDNQASMMKWRICWVLRQRFASNQLFGQYIDEFRSSVVTLCHNGRKEINRAWRAGKFCENYGINSLAEFKLSKTVIYELSAASNEDVAGKVLESIKTKDAPITVQETKLLLAQNKAVATIYPSNVDFEADVIESEVIDQISSEVIFTDEDQGIAKIIEFVQLYQDVVSKKRLITELEKLNWD